MNAILPLQDIMLSPGWESESLQVPDIPDSQSLESTFASAFEFNATRDELSSETPREAALTLRGQTSLEKPTFLPLAEWDQIHTP